jgi:dihydroorotate dehydrogenase (fumarate)
MVDLRTRYLGLELAHPVVASASPLSRTLDGIKRLEDGGAAAIVMFSLFEEQIRREQQALEHLTTVGTESFAEATSYFPAASDARQVGPERYLELLRKAVETVRVPVIASLNGVTSEGWIDHARMAQQAGAAAIELNIYHVAASPDESGSDVEQRYLDVLSRIKASVKIPVALKLGPFFSAMGHLAGRLDAAGADALVLFNRFYQPDIDLERRTVVPDLQLSSPSEIRLPLLWIAVLHGRLRAQLAATTGVHSPIEVVKYLMAGADVVMTTSALLLHGAAYLGTLVTGLRDWMALHGYVSVAQLRGSMSQRSVADPAAFERAQYVTMLQDWKNPYAAG